MVSDIPASKAMWNSPDNGTLQEAVRRGDGVAARQRLVRERAPASLKDLEDLFNGGGSALSLTC